MTDPATPPPNPVTGGPIGDEEGLTFRQIAVRVLLVAVLVVVVFLIVMMMLGARIAG